MPGLDPTALAAMAGWHLHATLLCGAAGPPFDLLEAWSQLFLRHSPGFACRSLQLKLCLLLSAVKLCLLCLFLAQFYIRGYKAPSLKGLAAPLPLMPNGLDDGGSSDDGRHGPPKGKGWCLGGMFCLISIS